MAAALFDAGGGDPAAFIDDDEHQNLAFEAAGDGFCRVELAGVIEFFELLADGLGPGPRGNRRPVALVSLLRWGCAGCAAGLGCSGRVSGGGAATGAGDGGRKVAASGSGGAGTALGADVSAARNGRACNSNEAVRASKSRYSFRVMRKCGLA